MGQRTQNDERRLCRVEEALSELIRCVAALSPEDEAIIVHIARHLPDHTKENTQ